MLNITICKMKFNALAAFNLLACIGSCQEISINYGRKPFGTVSYDKENNEGVSFEFNSDFGLGLLKLAQCFSTGDLEGHECFSYSSIVNASDPLQNLQFWLYLDTNKDIARISVASGEHAPGELAVLKEIVTGPVPVLSNEAQRKKESAGGRKPPVQKVTVTKVVEDEDGNQVEVQEEQMVTEEENLSWIEQNWKYCLIGFLVYVAVSGGGKGEQEEK